MYRKCNINNVQTASVQFSDSAVSDSLWPHGLQHTRLPCPSPTPRARSNTCPNQPMHLKALVAQMVKKSVCKAGDLGLLPGSGRSSGEGNGSPLHYSCLENPMDRGAWRATAHGVTELEMTEGLTILFFLHHATLFPGFRILYFELHTCVFISFLEMSTLEVISTTDSSFY